MVECACSGRGERSWSATSPLEWCVSSSSRRWPRHRSSSAPICCKPRPASRPASSGYEAHRPETARPRQASIPPSRSSTASTGCARIWPRLISSAWWSTTPTGRTPRPSAVVIRLPPLTRAGVAELVESRLGEAPDPVFVDACARATRGTPFLMHELVEALSEGGVAPRGDAARQVERIGARTVGRSIGLRLRRLPEDGARLARALSVLEQSDLLPAGRLAGLEE